MKFLTLVLLGFLSAAPLIAQNVGKFDKSHSAAALNDHYGELSTNAVTMWLSNNGSTSHNPGTDASGFEWPKGSMKYMIFEEGLVVGGIVNGDIRVGGSTYRQGLQAGPINPNGTASDPFDPQYRLYRLRKLGRPEFERLSTKEQVELDQDFSDWPVSDGAPWIDVDHDGRYEPDFDAWLDGDTTHDTPAFPGDEVVWYVSNDLDVSRTSDLYGSMPMGLEFQVLAWASRDGDVADRTVYMQYTVINKSTADIDQMYIARWVDPDLGYASDDLVGVDTTLGMMYAYNGTGIDAVYGGEPPALGIVWLQTPTERRPGSVARYGEGWREGYRNLPPSAFAFYINGDAVYKDPNLGMSLGAVEMYNYLQAKLHNGSDYIDPLTGQTVRFPLAGDPLTSSGWIDGVIHKPGDRRMLYSSGPFTLAPGDTQQVVLATTVGVGATPILALRDAKQNARLIRQQYLISVPVLTLDGAGYELDWPSRGDFVLRISASHDPNHETVALIRDASGAELLRIPLFDDGQHRDGAMDDGHYAVDFAHAALPTGGDLFIAVLEANEIRAEVPIGSMLPLVGEVLTEEMTVLSDHLDFNREAAPGENIIYSFRLANHSIFELEAWIIIIQNPLGETKLLSLMQRIAADGSVQLDGFQAGSDALSFDVPADAQPGSVLRIPLVVINDKYCQWNDTLTLTVNALSRPVYSGMLEHVAGLATGTLGYTVDDPANLQGHVLRVSVQGEDIKDKTLTIEDVTEGCILRSGVTPPDEYGHRSPSIAGIRLRSGGTIVKIDTAQGEIVPLPVLWNFANPQRSWFDVPHEIYMSYAFNFPGSSLSIFESYPVALVFDQSVQQKGYAYLRGATPNYGYQGYFESPVRAYDMRDTSHPRQIGIAFAERNGSATHDNRWYPTMTALDREFLLVLDSDYSDAPNPAFMEPLLTEAVNMPILYYLSPTLQPNNEIFENGDMFWMRPQVPISQRDVYMLDATTLGGIGAEPVAPASVVLYPNYPNPFNAATTIAYHVNSAEYVEIVLHDVLGRKLRTLVAEDKTAGTHLYRLVLDDAPSGAYFCRLIAGGQTYTQQLLLLR